MQAPIPDKTQVRSELIGTVVARWELVEKIGDGKNGAVYRAKHLDTQDTAAIKVTREAVGEREVRGAGMLGHPNIAKVLGLGRLPDGRHYIIMELMQGEGLDWALHRFGTMLPADAVRILYAVADALAAAHQRSLLHGNLRPSSVFLVREGDGPFQVKLLDFGISPPEGAPLPSVDTDLRALGVLGFLMLTGRREVPAQLPRPIAPVLPLALEEMIVDLVEAASKLRPRTAADVVHRLEPLRPLPPPVPAELAATQIRPATAPLPAPPPRALPLKPIGVAAAVCLAGLITWLAWPATEEPDIVVDAPPAQTGPKPPPVAVQPDVQGESPRAKTPPQPKAPRPIPTAEQLDDRISRLDARLRKKSGDQSEAVHMLSKQRLRLAGSPDADERKDVQKQLDLWEQAYLSR